MSISPSACQTRGRDSRRFSWMSIVIDVYQQFRPGAHHIFSSKEATKPTTMGYLLARLTSTGHVLQKNATEERMTAATVVIYAGCERTR
jgi:hypothetical protein